MKLRIDYEITLSAPDDSEGVTAAELASALRDLFPSATRRKNGTWLLPGGPGAAILLRPQGGGGDASARFEAAFLTLRGTWREVAGAIDPVLQLAGRLQWDAFDEQSTLPVDEANRGLILREMAIGQNEDQQHTYHMLFFVFCGLALLTFMLWLTDRSRPSLVLMACGAFLMAGLASVARFLGLRQARKRLDG